jgi:[acyl-carrier-protein] S-malonyltransferase
MNKKNIALVFPGQGSQSVGMLAELAAEYDVIRKTYALASKTLGYDLWHLIEEGPEDKLNQTEFSQPALLASGFAIWQVWLQKYKIKPTFLAGHSLGEYTALVCADALDFSEALQLVADRGRFMQEAVPVGKGKMAAIIGLPDAKIAEICQKAAEGEVLTVANYNSVGQAVLAGESNAIERALVLAKEANAKLVKLLNVSIPSHCPLMQPAAERLAKRLEEVTFNKPKIPVINNVDVCSYDTPDKIKDALVRQLYNPVRWVEIITMLATKNVKVIIEAGPGKVLTGLNKRIIADLITCSLQTPAGFAEIDQIMRDN